jgi:predicted phosphohydrolase
MSKIISIQVYSDLHIEYWNDIPKIPPLSEYLFLAGDVCVETHPLFYKFMDYCSLNWKKIFYIPGTNEFYSKTKNYNQLIFDYNHRLKNRYKNIYFLNNESTPLNDEIDVYGSTFWTKPIFNSTNESKMNIHDYNNITYYSENEKHVVDLNISYVKKLSEETYDSLKNHLSNTKKKTIIMTYFPPIREGTINPNLKNDKLYNLFDYDSWKDETINDLVCLDRKKMISMWISGHTHYSYDFIKNDIHFVSNQLGKKYDIDYSNFKMNGLYVLN